MIFDSSLTFDSHVKSVSRFFHLRNTSNTSMPELEKVIHAVLSPCLDCCNVLFTSLDKSSLSCLQVKQNAAARLLKHSGKQARITPILYSLHQFSVDFRIRFKILVHTLNSQTPDCLS